MLYASVASLESSQSLTAASRRRHTPATPQTCIHVRWGKAIQRAIDLEQEFVLDGLLAWRPGQLLKDRLDVAMAVALVTTRTIHHVGFYAVSESGSG